MSMIDPMAEVRTRRRPNSALIEQERQYKEQWKERALVAENIKFWYVSGVFLLLVNTALLLTTVVGVTL